MYPRKGNSATSAKERAAARLEELRKQEQLILEKKRLIEEQLKSQTNAPSAQLVRPVPKVDSVKVKKPLFHRLRSQLNMYKKVSQAQGTSSTSQEEQVSSSSTSPSLSEKDGKSALATPPLEKVNNETVALQKSNESPQTTNRCKEAESCAIYVAINGDEEEVNLTSRLAIDANYAWLLDKESIDYKYFRHRVQQLRSANERQLQMLDHCKAAQSSVYKSPGGEGGEDEEGGGDGNNRERDGEEREKGPADQESQEKRTSECSAASSSSLSSMELGKKKLKSRWGDPNDTVALDADLIEYAKRIYGSVELDESQWRQLEDQRKMRMLTNIMKARKESVYSLHKRRSEGKKAKNKYEYDSDEDTEGGTWEHKRRQEEMDATSVKAQQLTQMNKGKHHIGDFLPPDELEKFIKAWEQVKDGKASQLMESAYEKFKLTSNNIGYKMLTQMGWKEGQGLGSHPGSSRIEPIACSSNAGDKSGLGIKRPSELTAGDDEYEAYRKRMMIAYRFRPNPLNNPRREYY